ncbi:putative aflatoxin b1 aldehyde reductase-like protein [Dactylonectria macrodidyma]|uniref:Aflatoxin b1 aldehyde reductase-like protein n=1 Tax=Dactylonectria macrodidyma TaxID=307937 RepID=A0A9P9ETA8_9HYPO|nr:putative aflatoxin b1 aldehyde reductase-like protein [Dactylonectria macrodidyma]
MSDKPETKKRVILGLMTVGPEGTESEGARITSLDEFNRCLATFQHKGYNEVDTAHQYMGGKQEAFTAKARWRERGLSLATKWYPMKPGDHKPEVLRSKIEESLRELQTDRVDIFYLHGPDRATPFEETLGELDELYKQGKFKKWGLSNFSAFEVAEIVTTCNERGWVRPAVYQALYNVITRNIESELLPCCRRYGIDVVIFNPIAGGLLSGKYKSTSEPTSGRFSDQFTNQGRLYRSRYFKPSAFASLRHIEPVVQKHGIAMAEVALRWCLHHSALNLDQGGGDGVIIGFSSHSQLEENLEALEKGPLPEDLVQALDQAWQISKADATDFWHGKLAYSYNTRKVLFGE